MAEPRSPKIFDPYLGEMYGNVLDKYDNPAYNLRLYMKSEGGAAAVPAAGNAVATQGSNTTPADLAAQGINPRNIPSGNPTDPNLATSGSTARSDSPATANVTTTVADKKIVILAQNGVTGTQIDDLEITNGTTGAGGAATLGSFTIVQPGAANFLDQLQWTRKYLGTPESELTTNDFYLYLDINFLGYDSPVTDDINKDDNNDRGGEPTQIIDTVTYKIKIISIAISLNNTGSRYDIQFSNFPEIGFADDIYKIKSDITLQGDTITTLLESFVTKYNADLTTNANLFKKADQIQINLAALLTAGDSRTPTSKPSVTSTGATSAKLYIEDQTIPSPATDQNVELTTIPIFDGEINRAKDSTSGSTDPVISGVTLTAKAGSTIYTIIAQVLSMNKFFQRHVTRMESLDDPKNDKVDNKQTFVAWFGVHCEVQTIGWDSKRNKYAKNYIYTPYLIEDIRSDVALTTNEASYLTETVKAGIGDSLGELPVVAIATKKLQDLYNADALHKSYFYLFTGLNDQIINLDIKYDQGVTLLMPPQGGFIQEYSVVNSPAVKNSLPTTADATNAENLNAANDAKDKESVVGLFNKIKGIADDIKTVADAIGRSPTELAGILKDATGKSARALAQSLDTATVKRLATLGSSNSADPADTRTTNTDITVTSSGPYSPEVSGFLYSEDFVQPGGALTAEEIQAAGLQIVAVPASSPGATPIVRSLPSPLSGITSDGPASTLMGYLYRSRMNSNFLLNIELTLRGDPYWLTNQNSGKFEYGKPTPDQTTNPGIGKKQYFLLTIGSPRAYDYDLSDEDANTGYWTQDSTSGVFSGLYEPTLWKNRFSGGVFTTEITASKESAVPLQHIRRVLPGETPPAWDELLKDVDTAAIEANTRQLIAAAGGDGDGDGPSTYTPAGAGDGEWTKDAPFLAEVDRLAKKYDVDANDLLGLMQNESNLNPGIVNSIGCTGLIQFCPDKAGGSYKTLGGQQVQLADLARMSRSEQMKYVEKYYDDVGLPRGATAAQIYAATFLPAYANKPADFVLAREDGRNPPGVSRNTYDQNKGLDVSAPRGVITIGELGQVIATARNQIGL